jgi:hypothetical protein
MDASNGYGEDMYGFGNFDEAPGQVRCSKCHKTGHTIATHKKRKKSKKLEIQNGSHGGSKVKIGVAYIFHAFVHCFCTI